MRLLLLAVLAAPTLALAQPGPPAGGSRHHLFISPAGEPFRGADGLGAWFAQADADHDGALTPAELRADFQRFFKVLDANGDGQLDGFELQAYERDRVPEITRLGFDGPELRGGGPEPGGVVSAKGGRKRGQPAQIGRSGASRFGLLSIPQPVSNADEDLNGRVTGDEFTRAASRRFGLLDKAKAGWLTLDALRPPAAKAD